MHCPHCAFDNPLTTRFCTQCGGVLIEDAQPVARRRLPIMRPGIKRPFPPPSADAAARRGRRIEWAIAGLVFAAAFLTYWIYPGRTSAIVVEPAMFVPLPVSSSARFATPVGEGSGINVPRVPPQRLDVRPPAHPIDGMVSGPGGSRSDPAVRQRDRSRPPASREVVATLPSAPVVTPPVAAPVEPVRIEPAPPARAPDRWQQMEDEIARCASGTFFDRVICDQKVRIAFCEGHWGAASQCPTGRVADYGQ